MPNAYAHSCDGGVVEDARHGPVLPASNDPAWPARAIQERRRSPCGERVRGVPLRGLPSETHGRLLNGEAPRGYGAQGQSGRPDSNRGPHRPERCALPDCATPRRAESIPHPRARHDDIVAAMPVPTREILAELDRLLEPARFDDYAVNGLQVPGADSVSTVATGVSAHAELF